MAHSIITVATLKGGSGKSTLASCLAVYWQLKGRRSVIIDVDPQSTITRLATREKALGGVPSSRMPATMPTSRHCVWSMITTRSSSTHRVFAPKRRSAVSASPTCAGSRQALAVRRRSHAGHSEYPHQRRQRTAAGISLRPRPDHARLCHRQTHPVRTCGSGLPGARQRDDKPRHLSRGRALEATPSMIDKKGAAAREIAAIAEEVKKICDSMAPPNGQQAHEQEKVSQGGPADGGSDARGGRERRSDAGRDRQRHRNGAEVRPGLRRIAAGGLAGRSRCIASAAESGRDRRALCQLFGDQRRHSDTAGKCCGDYGAVGADGQISERALRGALRAQPHPLHRHRPDGRRAADRFRNHCHVHADLGDAGP